MATARSIPTASTSTSARIRSMRRAVDLNGAIDKNGNPIFDTLVTTSTNSGNVYVQFTNGHGGFDALRLSRPVAAIPAGDVGVNGLVITDFAVPAGNTVCLSRGDVRHTKYRGDGSITERTRRGGNHLAAGISLTRRQLCRLRCANCVGQRQHGGQHRGRPFWSCQ